MRDLNLKSKHLFFCLFLLTICVSHALAQSNRRLMREGFKDLKNNDTAHLKYIDGELPLIDSSQGFSPQFRVKRCFLNMKLREWTLDSSDCNACETFKKDAESFFQEYNSLPSRKRKKLKRKYGIQSKHYSAVHSIKCCADTATESPSPVPPIENTPTPTGTYHQAVNELFDTIMNDPMLQKLYMSEEVVDTEMHVDGDTIFVGMTLKLLDSTEEENNLGIYYTAALENILQTFAVRMRDASDSSFANYLFRITGSADANPYPTRDSNGRIRYKKYMGEMGDIVNVEAQTKNAFNNYYQKQFFSLDSGANIPSNMYLAFLRGYLAYYTIDKVVRNGSPSNVKIEFDVIDYSGGNCCKSESFRTVKVVCAIYDIRQKEK